jgi:predicted flap endonuclease-1-like 5' DNA nuclease
LRWRTYIDPPAISKGDSVNMHKQFKKIEKQKSSSTKFWWIVAVPAAALTVVWSLRKYRITRSHPWTDKSFPRLIPSTGMAAPVAVERNPINFKGAAAELTVQEMAGFDQVIPEKSESKPAVPPTASEDSIVEVSGALGLQEAELRRNAEMTPPPVTMPAKQDTSPSTSEDFRTDDFRTDDFRTDDFRIIEGIGPAITSILHNSGIHTYHQLSETAVDDLRTILNQAGLTHLADPSTWPEQAGLAANERWEELTEMQEQLQHGRKKS